MEFIIVMEVLFLWFFISIDIEDTNDKLNEILDILKKK